MEQLLLHLIGDYVTQSDWMATQKTTSSLAAFCHALLYSLPFLFLGSLRAVFVIFATHFLIDRLRLARYVVWAKNWLAPWRKTVRRDSKTEALGRAISEGRVSGKGVFEGNELRDFLADYEANPQYVAVRAVPSWAECSKTGYPPDRPDWLAVWLLIVADNTLHLVINYAALRWVR